MINKNSKLFYCIKSFQFYTIYVLTPIIIILSLWLSFDDEIADFVDYDNTDLLKLLVGVLILSIIVSLIAAIAREKKLIRLIQEDAITPSDNKKGDIKVINPKIKLALRNRTGSFFALIIPAVLLIYQFSSSFSIKIDSEYGDRFINYGDERNIYDDMDSSFVQNKEIFSVGFLDIHIDKKCFNNIKTALSFDSIQDIDLSPVDFSTTTVENLIKDLIRQKKHYVIIKSDRQNGRRIFKFYPDSTFVNYRIDELETNSQNYITFFGSEIKSLKHAFDAYTFYMKGEFKKAEYCFTELTKSAIKSSNIFCASNVSLAYQHKAICNSVDRSLVSQKKSLIDAKNSIIAIRGYPDFSHLAPKNFHILFTLYAKPFTTNNFNNIFTDEAGVIKEDYKKGLTKLCEDIVSFHKEYKENPIVVNKNSQRRNEYFDTLRRTAMVCMKQWLGDPKKEVNQSIILQLEQLTQSFNIY